MEEITVRLQISKGSASQGLRHLEEIGAVIRERSNGERCHRYSASQKLKNLTAGFLRERLLPSIESGRRRIERIEALLPQLEPNLRTEAQQKLAKLSRWHRRATSLLPIVQRFLQAD